MGVVVGRPHLAAEAHHAAVFAELGGQWVAGRVNNVEHGTGLAEPLTEVGRRVSFRRLNHEQTGTYHAVKRSPAHLGPTPAKKTSPRKQKRGVPVHAQNGQGHPTKHTPQKTKPTNKTPSHKSNPTTGHQHPRQSRGPGDRQTRLARGVGPGPHTTQRNAPARVIREQGRPKVTYGGVLLSHTLTNAVPSALEGLASGFGMGPGVSPPP